MTHAKAIIYGAPIICPQRLKVRDAEDRGDAILPVTNLWVSRVGQQPVQDKGQSER